MSLLPVSQNKRRALIRTLLFAFGAVLLALVLAMRVWDIELHGVVIALLIVFCILAMLEFTVFDEFSKQTHYRAWYWGSSAGAAGVALVQVLSALDVSTGAIKSFIATQLDSADPSQAFLSGMMMTLLFMVTGYVIIRGAMWLRDR